MKTIKLEIELTFDQELWYEKDDPESIEWFHEQLYSDNLDLFIGGDIGDFIGSVKVLNIKD